MRHTAPILFALILAGTDAAAKVEVVATLPDLAAIAREVAGDAATVTALARPNQDPHYVDPRPSLLLPLHRADLLITNGLELEIGWLPPLVVNSRNPRIQEGRPGHFDASSVVQRLQLTASADRSRGDVHPGGNPHFTYDPRQAKRVAGALAKRLALIDAPNARRYEKNFVSLAKALDEIAARERARFAALPAKKRQIVVFHQSLVYLNEWLGLEQVATVEPLPGIPPNPAHVAAVLKTMKRTGAKIVLQEDFYVRGPSRTLAKLVKGELVVVPGGTHFQDGERYVEHLGHITEALYAALSN